MKNFFYISVLMILFNTIINAQPIGIPVTAGWNLISPCCCDIDTNLVTTDPPGIIVGAWFEFSGGYNVVDFLLCSVGYWVKVNAPGFIYICDNNNNYNCPPYVYYEGKTYNTVLIKHPTNPQVQQCWLKENLDVGIMIPGSQDQADNSELEKYCYDDNPANCITDGGLYQWDEAMKYFPGEQGICPEGWHIPTETEFTTLSTIVGGDGNALKREDQGTGGGAGTNTSGFSALLAGNRHIAGIFTELGLHGYFWSSTDVGVVNNARYMYVTHDNNIITINSVANSKDAGLSVRCLRDYSE